MDTVQLLTSHSQRLSSGKPLGTGRYEWTFAPYPTWTIQVNRSRREDKDMLSNAGHY